MKKQPPPHKQIKAIEAEIARLQNSLPTLELKDFETTCSRINQLKIKIVQQDYPGRVAFAAAPRRRGGARCAAARRPAAARR